MSQQIHTVEVPDDAGSGMSRRDRVLLGNLQVANAAGGGAGQAVTVAVAVKNLPAKYSVLVNPGQDATWFVTQASKNAAGFTVTLYPRLAANTLAAGTIDVMIFG